ncbi:CPBP family intramembrane glutamic endopeptidase [Colwellia sp. Bg11-12]|jgi:membrane protease YdiL (CAAX protease family)|uniref:CPBP family intramembrane glutamic endopeptidase n=1 Tax=Colwellia sp. Bg11-12 TaxID=2759817 RepID=UPI0015F58334|nr:CPBP family intramembrane glutamic endopeptidase [Colwellia sp. Bg11-12]MBA6264635.1 CPBP family intramembrane metalloprotease [Colwellia sp. Bg11-12]
MNNNIKALIMIATFIFCHYVMRYFWGDGWSEALLAMDQQSYLLFTPAKYLFIYGPLVLVAALLFKQIELAEILGLKVEGFKNYFLAAVLCCLPMTVGYAYLSSELNLALSGIIVGSVYAGVFEEILFRAVLFGVLFRYCGLGFIPAALVSSVIFGMGHIYQGHDALSAFASFAVTSVAGTWFAWLFCESGYRIWFPLWMHIFMNAAYGIFGMSGGAAGDLEGNIFKASSIILSLVYIHLLVRRGKKREITRASLWKNKSVEGSQYSLTTRCT